MLRLSTPPTPLRPQTPPMTAIFTSFSFFPRARILGCKAWCSAAAVESASMGRKMTQESSAHFASEASVRTEENQRTKYAQ